VKHLGLASGMGGSLDTTNPLGDMMDWPGGISPAAPRWFQDLLRQAVASILQATGWPASHIWVRDSSGEKLISLDAGADAAPGRFAAWDAAQNSHAYAEGIGLAGAAWKSRGLISTHDTCAGLNGDTPDEAPGWAVAFPILCNEQAVAVVALLHADKQVDDAPLVALAGCLAPLLGRLAAQSQRSADRMRLTALVEASDDAIIATDPVGTILSWNTGAERLYGYTRDEAIGSSLEMIVPPELRSTAPVLRTVLREARRLEQFETVRRRKNGQFVDVSITAAPILDRTGRVAGASTIERDVTHSKRVETERLRALSSAESANRAKSEFLANVSHELRTPMNAILGMIELSLGEDLPATVLDYLDTAHDSAQVLLFLLNDLLDFSRNEAGAFELEPSPLKVRRTFDQSMRTLSLRAHEKGLELLCRISPDVPDQLIGDSRRIQQIVMNLGGNAIKFTDVGEVVVEVALVSEDAESVELQLTVTDTGIGISAEDQQRIFAPFTQADSSSTRKYSGAGLGLAIARELATRMHGRLWVESELDKGSRFCCTMRLERPAPGSIRSAEGDDPSGLAGQRVLVIDDNPTNRTLLDEMLKGWGALPVVCSSGREALEILRDAPSDRFSLVIVDAMMPEMDGFMFLETAERQQVLQGSTIVMLSSGGRQMLEQRSRQLDVAVRLEKPISQKELREAISDALGAPGEARPTIKKLLPAPRSYRILVAEDTRANQKVVKAILGRRGHTVDIVENGRDAVARLQRDDYDVVVMDAQMPTMNGLQATEAIRHINNADRAGVPIIAMTAHAMREDRERCLAAGMDDYLPKPVDAADLVRVVEMYADRWVTARSTHQIKQLKRPGSASASQGTPALNLQSALVRLGGSEEILRQLLGLVRSDAENLIARARSALDLGDLKDVGLAAHNLRGAALNLDATPTVDAAKVLELAADRGDESAAREALATLETVGRELLDELDRLRSSGE